MAITDIRNIRGWIQQDYVKTEKFKTEVNSPSLVEWWKYTAHKWYEDKQKMSQIQHKLFVFFHMYLWQETTLFRPWLNKIYEY